MKHSVLIVDDEPDNLDALERLFRKKYYIYRADSGDEALEIVKKQKLSLIISDQRMPEMSGVEFLKKSQKHQPETIRILLTGYTDIQSVIESINSGQVYRYLTKPWDSHDLQNTVDKAVETYELRSQIVIKNKELSEALTELQSLDASKNKFMLLINHELKTPLTSAMSYTELLGECLEDESLKKYNQRVDESLNRLNHLINDSLEMVSAESGIKKIKVKKLDIKKLTENLEGQFLPQLETENKELSINIEKANIQADPELLNDIMKRLIDNAIKFGKKNSTISVTGVNETDTYKVSIVNSGKTLTKKTIETILKAFELDENMMNHSKGTGLGLSICQAYLKLMNSELNITSEKDQVSVSFHLKHY